MRLLPREWDMIMRALDVHIRKLETDSQVGFPSDETQQIDEIKTLIETRLALEEALRLLKRAAL